MIYLELKAFLRGCCQCTIPGTKVFLCTWSENARGDVQYRRITAFLYRNIQRLTTWVAILSLMHCQHYYFRCLCIWILFQTGNNREEIILTLSQILICKTQTSRNLPIRNHIPIPLQFWKLNCIAESWVALSILLFNSENILKGLNYLLWLQEFLAIPTDKENPRRYFYHNRKPIAIHYYCRLSWGIWILYSFIFVKLSFISLNKRERKRKNR